MNKKLIGMICVWGAELFIESAIKQALAYCDEVNVCVSPHTESIKKFRDSTFDICKKYEPNINLYYVDCGKDHASSKATILNLMLLKSKYFEVGDRKSTRLNSSHKDTSRMPSSA